MDHANPQLDGLGWTAHAHCAASDPYLARVRLQHPIQHFHQRAFACTVFTKQRVDLALPDRQTNVIVGEDAGKAFRDVLHFNKVGGNVHE